MITRIFASEINFGGLILGRACFLSLFRSELYGYVTPLHMLMIGLEASTK